MAWDVKTTGAAKTTITEALVAAMKPRSWVRPLPDVYIVPVTSDADLEAMKDQLLIVCREHTSAVNVLISPIMTGGTYKGWLPKEAWPKIAERSGL